MRWPSVLTKHTRLAPLEFFEVITCAKLYLKFTTRLTVKESIARKTVQPAK